MAEHEKPQTTEERPALRVGLFTAWAASTGLLLILVVIIADWSLQRIEDRARARARDDAMQRIESVRNRLQEELTALPGTKLEDVVKSARWVPVVLTRKVTTGANVEWVAVLSPTGTVLARSGGDTGGEPSETIVDALLPAGGPVAAVSPPRAEDEIIRFAAPVMIEDREFGTVEIALSARSLDAAIAELLRPVWLAFLLLGSVCFVVLLLGGVVMRHLLRRERMLDRAAAKQEHLAAMGALARRMVHEIRNPLNAMRMQIAVIQDMLSDPALPTECVRTDHLGRLDQEVTRLERLAKSFLAFGRPPQDEHEMIRVADLIRDVAEFIRPAFERIGARVAVEVEPEDEALCVRMDRSRLREALLNLTENAREAMDGGSLTLRLARASDREVTIRVADTGRGIPEADLPRIFDGLRSTKTDGSGLGLLIVKRIVESAGGVIRAESHVGRGSCFTITLPASPNQPEALPQGVRASCPEASR